jgi:tRNA nucleotidyltransferase (CCA-adding enzyme)
MDRIALTLPLAARRLIVLLEANGHEAFVVGGCVRDALLDRPLVDIDIATSALPDQIMMLAETAGITVHPTGLPHGTVTVVLGDESFEITTYRVDGIYRDARHPETVTFARSIRADLARRDFTINALAYSPTTDELVDPFGGTSDLAAGIIRCVGDPSLRLNEDALRIMRALRFSAQLGFDVEEETAQACHDHAPLLDSIAAERVGDEFLKLVRAPYAAQTIRLFWDIIVLIIPEIAFMKGFEQDNPHHPHDVAEHTLAALETANNATIVTTPSDPIICMTLLMHDIGKPFTCTHDEHGSHFYGHAERGSLITHDILSRLRYPRIFVDEVCQLVKYHGVCITTEEKNIKHWMNRLGSPTFHRILDVKRGDVSGLRKEDQGVLALFDDIEQIAWRIERSDACFSLKRLAITGNDIIDLGVEPGPQVGTLLNTALNAVINEEVVNEKHILVDYLHKRIADSHEH